MSSAPNIVRDRDSQTTFYVPEDTDGVTREWLKRVREVQRKNTMRERHNQRAIVKQEREAKVREAVEQLRDHPNVSRVTNNVLVNE